MMKAGEVHRRILTPWAQMKEGEKWFTDYRTRKLSYPFGRPFFFLCWEGHSHVQALGACLITAKCETKP
jgi:hypothetical protein